jgi:glycerophosphoryl diester phosphodiesterase
MKVSTKNALTVLGTAALCTSTFAFATPAGADTPPIECVAHRGNPTTHTEETMPTYSAILATNPDAIDGDIRFSSTGYPYMIHDASMGQFNHPSVNIADISGTTAVSYRSDSGDHIASLYEVSQALVAQPGMRLEVELKIVPTSAEWTMLASRLDPIRNRTTVTSFDLDTVRSAQDEGYRTAWLTDAPTTSAAAPTVDENYASITAGEVSGLNGVGVQVEGWAPDPATPDSASDWNALLAKGVRTLNTDDEVGCMSWKVGK